jgi:hypothetical protein
MAPRTPQSYAVASANPNELFANDPPRNDLSEVQPIAALQMPSWQQIPASVPETMGPPGPADSFESRWTGLQKAEASLSFGARWALDAQ